LRSLFNSLREQKTCDDYGNTSLTWPRIVSWKIYGFQINY
jgi:hypothetical protein